jgi:hypothetical protein
MLSGLSALGNLFYGGPSAEELERQQAQQTAAAQMAINDQAQAARNQAANQTQSLFAQTNVGGPLAARQAMMAGANAAAQTAGNAAQQRMGLAMQQRGEARQDAQAARTRKADAISGLIGAGAQGASMLLSDERAKTAIRDAGQMVDQFLDDLSPQEYEYREGMGPPGAQAGVMAQDLEQNPVGRSMVTQGDDGMRRVDGPRAAGAALAGLGRLRERLDELEERLGRGR